MAKGAFLGFAVLVVLLLVTGTYVRNQLWNDPFRFWNQVVERAPNHPRGYFNLADVLREKGDLEGAAKHYQKVTVLQPDNELAGIFIHRSIVH